MSGITALSLEASNSMDLDGANQLKEMVPAAEKTALLFHISYLCLGKFPELERIVRESAVDVQLSFTSAEAVLQKCISTSDNMVNLLFVALRKAVEKENAELAQLLLIKATEWILDITTMTNEMVDKYGDLDQGIILAASNVTRAKRQTEIKLKEIAEKEKAVKENVDGGETAVEEKKEEIAKKNKALEASSRKLQQIIAEMTGAVKRKNADLVKVDSAIGVASKVLQTVLRQLGKTNPKVAIVATVVPFVYRLIASMEKRAILNAEDKLRLQQALDELQDLRNQKALLEEDLGRKEAQLMHHQFELSKISIEMGLVPDPVHLPEVKQNLIRIREIFIQLQSFWKSIEMFLKYMQLRTTSGEDLLKFIEQFKDEFLDCIETASEDWIEFKNGCAKISEVYRVRTKDSYKFLRFNPTLLSDQEWQTQYNSLRATLQGYQGSFTLE